MSTTALAITALLLLFPIIVSYVEKLHIIKDLVVATVRAVIQLVILGFILHFIFDVDQNGYSYSSCSSSLSMRHGTR